MATEEITPLQIQRQRERVLAMAAWSVICLLAAGLAYVHDSMVFVWINCWISGFAGCLTLLRIERLLHMQVDAGTLHHRS